MRPPSGAIVPHNAFEQRRFADAVRPTVAVGDTLEKAAKVMHGWMTFVTERQIMKGYGGRGYHIG